MEHIGVYIPTVKEEKQLSDREKKWTLQREIFHMVARENLKPLNWKRYVAFLRKYKIDERKLGREACINRWKKESREKKNADVREVKKLTKSSFGYFTNHLNEEGLWYIKSVIQDKEHRGESPTLYILSLIKHNEKAQV